MKPVREYAAALFGMLVLLPLAIVIGLGRRKLFRRV